MTDIGFPNNPALNELYTSGWSTWMWDGVKWMASVPSGGVYEPVFGGTQYPMYGFLYQKTPGDPGYSDWAGFGAHRWRFGISPGDDFAAGSIDYRGYVSDALSIVGAGATAGTRKINLYDNVNVSGNLTVGTTTILGGGGGIVSVGNITATGPLTISGPMGTTGSNAIFTFQDRTGTTNWGWYAQAGVARLWNDASGDRVTIDGGGSIRTGGYLLTGSNIFMGGQALYFSGVTAGGPFIFANTTDMVSQLGTGNGTFYWYNNPGAEVMRLDSAGKLVAHNEIHSQGSAASLWFQDRGGAFEWTWYSDSNQAKLYNTYGGVGRVVVTVDVNGQGVFAQGVYGAAFAINGTAHYIYDAGNGRLGFRAGGAVGPYGYASLGADSGWICGPLACGNIACNVINASGNVNPGYAVDTGDAAIELGLGRTGTGNAYIDFHAQPGTDFDFRIQRFPGAAGATQLISNGGGIDFYSGTGCIYTHGISGRDGLIVFRSGGDAYLTIVPEYGTNQTLIGYYIPNVGWGSLNLAGSVTLGAVNTGDIHCNNVFAGNYICMAGNTNGGTGPTYYADNTHFIFRLGPSNGGFYFQDSAQNTRFVLDSGANIAMAGGFLTFRSAGASFAAKGPKLYGDDNWIVAQPGTGNLGFMLYDVNGAMRAQIGAAGNILLTGNGNSGQVRMANTNDGSGYGSFWRNDNTSTYLLLTAVNDAFGQWNTLRPFTVDNASGNVSMAHQVTVGGLTVNGALGCGGNFTCQGSIYTNHIVMNNGCVLYGRDTAGNQQWLCTLWTDNAAYYCDSSRDSHLRGATVYVDSTNIIRCNQAILVSGGNGMFQFADRTDGITWGWYATGSVARFWDNLEGDRLTIDRGGSLTAVGNVRANGSIGANGIWFGNNGGWWWTGSPIHTDSDFQVNSVYAVYNYFLNGLQVYNNGGAWYFANQINCNDIISRGNLNSAGVLYVNGLMIQNYTGWWWTGSPIHTDSEMQCSALTAGGHRIYDNGGWLYSDAGIHANQLYSRNDSWCANNMTAGGSMQANGTGWSLYAPNGGIYTPNEVHGGLVTSGGDIRLGGSVTCSGWYYGGGNGGAQIRCWAGDWGAMSYAISNSYFEISPDQGQSGFYYAPAGNWSDARLKLNIRDSEIDALAVLGAIPVRAFEWTEEGRGLMPRDGPSVSCGIVAQELEELIPSAVDIVPVSGGLAGGGMRRIIGDQIDAYYIRAIQQLAARIEELEDLVRNPRSLT